MLDPRKHAWPGVGGWVSFQNIIIINFRIKLCYDQEIRREKFRQDITVEVPLWEDDT